MLLRWLLVSSLPVLRMLLLSMLCACPWCHPLGPVPSPVTTLCCSSCTPVPNYTIHTLLLSGLEPLISACLAAAGRKKKVYRNAGLAALHTILTALVNPSGGSTPGVDRIDQTLDVYALVAPLLLGSIQQHVEKPEASSSSKAAAEAVAAQQSSSAAGGGKEGGADGAGSEEAPQPLPLAECLRWVDVGGESGIGATQGNVPDCLGGSGQGTVVVICACIGDWGRWFIRAWARM